MMNSKLYCVYFRLLLYTTNCRKLFIFHINIKYRVIKNNGDNMKKIKSLIIVIMVLVSLVAVISAYRIREFPVCTDPNNQMKPDIYGNIIVWYDDRNNPGINPDIYGYNLSTHTEFFICTHLHWQQNPAIHGNIIVWEDYRDDLGGWTDCNIYGYDMGPDGIYGTLDDVGEFQITTDINGQYLPDIYGNIVVWADDRNGIANRDIYGYDMGTDGIFGTGDDVGEFQITTDTNGQYYPAIYDNIVVWQDYRNGPLNSDIYGYNLSTHTEFQVITDTMCQYVPAIYDNIVVWVHGPAGLPSNYDIYGCNLSTHTVFPIVTYPNNLQQDPAIYDNIVVWQDSRTWPDDIYGAVLEEEFFANPIAAFMPVKNYHLRQVNTCLGCIEENLPEDVPEDVQNLLDEMQEHINNANTTGNSIYANNELLKALKRCEDIQEKLGITCS